MGKFTIDFFELMFLAESVIPNKPIARSMCFDSFSNVHHHSMSKGEREQFFKHVTECNGFSMENEQCQHFFARFNPKNQFLVNTNWRGKNTEHECYFFDGEYHTNKSTFINSESITWIIRIYDSTVIDLPQKNKE